ncbi:hypothetical protein BC829DRAFT_378144 [Chytridium lagenaria]|nr:hypothetical protein BC829DRAFT_378144 [Chytridium lagenaria]
MEGQQRQMRFKHVTRRRGYVSRGSGLDRVVRRMGERGVTPGGGEVGMAEKSADGGAGACFGIGRVFESKVIQKNREGKGCGAVGQRLGERGRSSSNKIVSSTKRLQNGTTDIVLLLQL